MRAQKFFKISDLSTWMVSRRTYFAFFFGELPASSILIWLESLELTPVLETALPFLAKKMISATKPTPATAEKTAMRMMFLVVWSSDVSEVIVAFGLGLQAWYICI